MKQKLLAFAMLLLLMVAATSCLKDDGLSRTFVLPKVGNVPINIIPPDVRLEFEEHMVVYEGAVAPDISGEYLASPNLLAYSNIEEDIEIGYRFADEYIAFIKQSNGMYKYYSKQGSSTSEADSVIVVGSGNKFSAYFVENLKNSDDGVTAKLSTIITGTITSKGIENYKNAFVMLEKNDPNHLLINVNAFRITEDGDNVAENYRWRSGSYAPQKSVKNGQNQAENDLFDYVTSKIAKR